MVKRKNFLPTLAIALLFWTGLIVLVVYTSPSSAFLLTTFYLLLFIALFLTLSLIFANSRRGFLIAIGLVISLLLRYFKIAHFLNLGLLIGILISLEVYLGKR